MSPQTGPLSSPARVVVAEATTGVMAVGGVALVVLATVLAFLTKQDDYQWSDRTTLAALCDVFTGPLLAGITCLNAVRRGQMGLTEMAGATTAGRWFPARVSLLAGGVWAVLATLVQVLATTLARSPFGTPFTAWMLLPWLLTLTLLAVCASVGAVVGSRSTVTGAAPATALVLFLGLYVPLGLTGRASVLVPLDNGTFYTPVTEPAPLIIVWHVILSAAVLAATGAVLAADTRTRRTALAVAVLCVAVAVPGLATASPDRARFRAFHGTPACAQRDGVQLCVWPVMQDQLSDQLEALAAAHHLVASSWQTAIQFAQVGLPSSSLPRPDAVRIYLPNPPSQYLAMVNAVQALLPHCTGPAEAASQAASNLQEWLFARLGDTTDTDTDTFRVTTRPEPVQRAWVQRQLTAGGCT